MNHIQDLLNEANSSKSGDETIRKTIITKLNYLKAQLTLILNSSTPDTVSLQQTQAFQEISDQIAFIASKKLELFRQEEILTQLKIFLRTSIYTANKKVAIGKKNISSISANLSSKILYQLYSKENFWPLDFIVLYLDDALGARQWVDLDGEASIFVQNVIASPPNQTSFLNSNSTKLTSKAKKDMKVSTAFTNNSDEEEEEILEEGGGDESVIYDKSPVRYRYLYCKNDTTSLVLSVILGRCKSLTSIDMATVLEAVEFAFPQVPDVSENPDIAIVLSSLQSSTGATWALVSTMTSLSDYHPMICLAASLCLERWIGNPAITDYVRNFLHHIASVIQRTSHSEEINLNSEEGFNVSSEQSININDIIIREIVKIRQKIKPTQHDIYRNALVDLARIGKKSCVVVIRSLIEDEVLMGNSGSGVNSTSKGDTVKLIVSLLQSARQTTITADSSKETSEIFGLSIRQLCIRSRHWPRKSSSRISANLETLLDSNQQASDWNSTTVKAIVDLTLRCIRSIGAREISYDSFFNAILPSPSTLRQVIHFMSEPTRQSQSISTYSFFHHILYSLWNDLCGICQALLGHELAIIDSQSASKPVSKKPEQHDLDTQDNGNSTAIPRQTGSRNMPLPNNPGMFHASSGGLFKSNMPIKRPTAVTSKPGNGTPALFRTASSSMPVIQSQVDSSCSSNANLNQSIPDSSISQARQICLSNLLSIHEAIALFLSSVIKILNEEKRLRVNHDEGFGFSWLLSILGLNIDSISKFVSSTETIDKLSPFYVRDNGSCSDKLLSSLTIIIENWSFTTTDMSAGISVIEAVVDRASKTTLLGVTAGQAPIAKSVGDLATVHINDMLIIPKLLSLSLLYLIKQKQDEDFHYRPYSESTPVEVFVPNQMKINSSESTERAEYKEYENWRKGLVHSAQQLGSKRKASHFRTMLELSSVQIKANSQTKTKVQTNSPALSKGSKEYIPRLTHRQFYWRLSRCLYLLGCARPKTVGRFLWESLPSIQTLLLMSMTGRYYYPPTGASEDIYLDSVIGSNHVTISTSSNSSQSTAIVQNSQSLEKKDIMYSKNRFHESNEFAELSSFTASNGVAFIISDEFVEVSKATTREVIQAVSEFEKAIGQYYLGIYQQPVEQKQSQAYSDRVTTREARRRQEMAELELERQEAQAKREQAALQRSMRAAQRAGNIAQLQSVDAPLSVGEVQVADILTSFAFLVSSEMSSTNEVTGKRSRDKDNDSNESGNGGRKVLKRSRNVTEEEAEFEDNNSLDARDTTTNAIPFVIPENPNIKIPDLVIPQAANLYSTVPFFTQYGTSLSIQDVMICNIAGEGICPIPGDDIIAIIKSLDLKYNLGHRLRSCEEPDFIASAILGNQSDNPISSGIVPEMTKGNSSLKNGDAERERVERSLGWLIPAIAADVDGVLKRLPPVAAAYVLTTLSSKIYSRLAVYKDIWDTSKSSSSAHHTSIYSIKSSDDLYSWVTSHVEHVSDVALMASIIGKILPLVGSSISKYASGFKDVDKSDITAGKEIQAVIALDLRSTNSERRHGAVLILAYLQHLFTNSQTTRGSILQCISPLLRTGSFNCQYIDILEEIGTTDYSNCRDEAGLEITEHLLRESNNRVLATRLIELKAHRTHNISGKVLLSVCIAALSESPLRSQDLLTSISQLCGGENIMAEVFEPLVNAWTQRKSYSPYLSTTQPPDTSVKSAPNTYLPVYENDVSPPNYFIRADVVRALLLINMHQGNSSSETKVALSIGSPLRDILLTSLLSAVRPHTIFVSYLKLFIDIFKIMLTSSCIDVPRILTESLIPSTSIISMLLSSNTDQFTVYGISVEGLIAILEKLDNETDSKGVEMLIQEMVQYKTALSGNGDKSDEAKLAVRRRLVMMFKYLTAISDSKVLKSQTARSVMNILNV